MVHEERFTCQKHALDALIAASPKDAPPSLFEGHKVITVHGERKVEGATISKVVPERKSDKNEGNERNEGKSDNVTLNDYGTYRCTQLGPKIYAKFPNQAACNRSNVTSAE